MCPLDPQTSTHEVIGSRSGQIWQLERERSSQFGLWSRAVCSIQEQIDFPISAISTASINTNSLCVGLYVRYLYKEWYAGGRCKGFCLWSASPQMISKQYTGITVIIITIPVVIVVWVQYVRKNYHNEVQFGVKLCERRGSALTWLKT